MTRCTTDIKLDGVGPVDNRMNHEAVYRTAPATPGLLIINRHGVAGAVLSPECPGPGGRRAFGGIAEMLEKL